MPQPGYAGTLTINGNELCEVQDVTLSQSVDEIETSNRCDDGNKSFIAGLRELTLDFDMIWKSSMGVAAQDVETAFSAKSSVAVQVLDEDGEGWSFDAIVTKYDKNEPLADAQTVSVTLRGTGAATKVSGTS